MRNKTHHAQAREAISMATLYAQQNDHAAAAFHYMVAARLMPWWRCRKREDCIRQALICAVRGWPVQAGEPEMPPPSKKIIPLRKP
jgi:hypothetical protein